MNDSICPNCHGLIVSGSQTMGYIGKICCCGSYTTVPSQFFYDEIVKREDIEITKLKKEIKECIESELKKLLNKFDREFPVLTRQTDADRQIMLIRFWLAKEIDQLLFRKGDF